MRLAVYRVLVSWLSARRKGVPTLTSCKTNNRSLCGSFCCRFAADGVSFSLNSDDPGIMLIDLTNEYEVAERDLGLTQEQIIQSVGTLRQTDRHTNIQTDMQTDRQT